MKFHIETFDITFTFSDYEPPIKVPFFSSDNGLLFTFRKTVELIITGDITTPTKVIEPWLKKNVEYANCIVNPQMSTDFVQRYENEYISKEKSVKRRLYIGSVEKKNKYTIVKYDNKHPEKMLDMPMDAVISSMFFFLNLGRDVGITTLKSLSKQGKIPKLQDHILRENGDGINQFLASLEETLQNLNISLN